MDVLSYITSYEEGDLSFEDTVDLFNHLWKTGMIYQLQGSYQRTMNRLIDAGHIGQVEEEVNHD